MVAPGPMDTEHLLATLERIEEEAGKLYTWLSEVFAADAEASKLFVRLAEEEARHRDLIRFQRQLARRSAPSEASGADAENLPATLRMIMSFREQNPYPTLREAVQFAMRLEDSPAEAKYRTAIAQTSPNMASLINSLNSGDDDHGEALFDFAKERGLL